MRIAATLALLLSCTAAHSLECKRATTPVDRSLCANADLVRTDEQLSRTFVRLMRDPATGDVEALRASQRAWAGDRDRKCGGMDGAMLSDCLRESYARRQEALDAVKGVNEFGEDGKTASVGGLALSVRKDPSDNGGDRAVYVGPDTKVSAMYGAGPAHVAARISDGRGWEAVVLGIPQGGTLGLEDNYAVSVTDGKPTVIEMGEVGGYRKVGPGAMAILESDAWSEGRYRVLDRQGLHEMRLGKPSRKVYRSSGGLLSEEDTIEFRGVRIGTDGNDADGLDVTADGNRLGILSGLQGNQWGEVDRVTWPGGGAIVLALYLQNRGTRDSEQVVVSVEGKKATIAASVIGWMRRLDDGYAWVDADSWRLGRQTVWHRGGKQHHEPLDLVAP